MRANPQLNAKIDRVMGWTLLWSVAAATALVAILITMTACKPAGQEPKPLKTMIQSPPSSPVFCGDPGVTCWSWWTDPGPECLVTGAPVPATCVDSGPPCPEQGPTAGVACWWVDPTDGRVWYRP